MVYFAMPALDLDPLFEWDLFALFVSEKSYQGMLVFVALWVVQNSWARSEMMAFWSNRLRRNNHLSRHAFFELNARMQERLPFYARLSDAGRGRFIERMQQFRKGKVFVGEEGLVVTNEMEEWICAAAAQLTFGLESGELEHIKVVKVFRSSFYHKVSKQWMKGATFGNGLLALSWEDFQEGYADEADNYNLGLHEMAHALKLDARSNQRFETFFAHYLDRWLDISKESYHKLKDGDLSYLRTYGGSNAHEFFAVCVEHFFESPRDFAQELPDVFHHLCLLLGQNPMNENEDYHLSRHFRRDVNSLPHLIPLPKVVHFKGFNRFHRQMMLGMILTLLALVIFSNPKLHGGPFQWEAAALLTALVSAVQLPYVVRNRYLLWRYIPVYVFSTFGVMMFLLFIAAALAGLIEVPE